MLRHAERRNSRRDCARVAEARSKTGNFDGKTGTRHGVLRKCSFEPGIFVVRGPGFFGATETLGCAWGWRLAAIVIGAGVFVGLAAGFYDPEAVVSGGVD